MRHRVFIAINLSESVKKRLAQYQEKFSGLTARWTKTASLHLTLVFIGYVTDTEMLEICRVSREVAAKCEPFLVSFEKIILAPIGKKPRMIWLEGEANDALDKLKNNLEEALLAADSGLRHLENRPMRPHITLARIKQDQWRAFDAPSVIGENFQAEVAVESIEVMESDLKRDGAEYAALESCPLKM